MNLKPCPACGSPNALLRGSRFVACASLACNMIGPTDDPDGTKWNSLPRSTVLLEPTRLEIATRLLAGVMANPSCFEYSGVTQKMQAKGGEGVTAQALIYADVLLERHRSSRPSS